MHASIELEPAPDSAAFAVFSSGALGRVHAQVHRSLNARDPARAAVSLERCLPDAPGADARSVHLHWHLLVLDAQRGRLAAARARFLEQVLPFIPLEWARCDGPAGLWYLALALGRAERLPWEAAAQVALSKLDERDGFLAMHDALALAGAEALPELARWTEQRWNRREAPLAMLGLGLRAWVRREWRDASHWLTGACTSHRRRLGGSRAQWELFEQLGTRAHVLARAT